MLYNIYFAEQQIFLIPEIFTKRIMTTNLVHRIIMINEETDNALIRLSIELGDTPDTIIEKMIDGMVKQYGKN